MDLLRRHITAMLSSAPRTLTAGRTVVLPSEGPEFCRERTITRTGFVAGFLAMAAKLPPALFSGRLQRLIMWHLDPHRRI